MCILKCTCAITNHSSLVSRFNNRWNMSKQKARTIQSLAQAAKKSTGQGKDGLSIQTIAGHTTTPDGDL